MEFFSINKNKWKSLPIDRLAGHMQTPNRNSEDPTKKTISMIMAYPSRPFIENGSGVGGSGGGFGHDASQSTHEQAGVFSCENLNNNYTWIFPLIHLPLYFSWDSVYPVEKKTIDYIILTSSGWLHGTTFGSCGV